MTTLLCHNGRIGVDTRVTHTCSNTHGQRQTVFERRLKLRVEPHLLVAGAGCMDTLHAASHIFARIFLRVFGVTLFFSMRRLSPQGSPTDVFLISRRGHLRHMTVKRQNLILGWHLVRKISQSRQKPQRPQHLTFLAGSGAHSVSQHLLSSWGVEQTLLLAGHRDPHSNTEQVIFNLVTWRFEHLPKGLPTLNPWSTWNPMNHLKSLARGQGWLQKHDTQIEKNIKSLQRTARS